MDNLMFSLNATLPVFLTMLLGAFFRKIGVMDEAFAARLDRFVFRITLPVMLFENLATVDFLAVWDIRFVGFCFLVTLGCILLLILVSFVWKDRSIQGEFIQGAYRSSAAILGVAFISNMYGNSGMAPLMIVATVPLYNMMAVVVLSVFGPAGGKMDREKILSTVKGIVTNPIILGILAGTVWSLLKLPLPTIAAKTVNNVSKLATPLGLMSMGASFKWGDVSEHMKPVVAATFIKLVGLPAVFLPVAVMMGFTTEKLMAILVMLGSATTVSGYIMAKNMGHEGSVSAGTVMFTTLFSAVSMTAWIFILRSMGYL